MNHRIYNRRIEIDETGEGDFVDFCENIYVSQIKKNLLTNIETVKIVIETRCGEDITIELLREEIGTRIIPTLVSHGFTCVDNRANNEFVQYILFCSENDIAQKHYIHDQLGFVKSNSGNNMFLLYNPIGDINASKLTSTHVHGKSIKPHGSLTGWRLAVKKHIYSKGNMELALALGAVSPIAHLFIEAGIINEVPLYALIGASSSGKTTSLFAEASIWFSKEQIADFNCTQTAFVEQLCESKGMAMLVDESSAVADWDFTGLLYNLPKGQSKLRCNSDGSLRERKNFSGAIIFTGERSLFEQTNGNRGLEARLLELNLPWTVDASHAEAIAKDFSIHYGVAAPILIKWLLANVPLIKNKFLEYQLILKELCRNRITDQVVLRLIKLPALALTAAYALNCALNLHLNIDSIQDTLFNVLLEKANTLKNNPEVWHEKILCKILDYKDKFHYPDNLHSAKVIYGIHGKHKGEPIIWVREDIFEKWLTDISPAGFDYARKILAKKELIYYNNRHYKTKPKFFDSQVDFYGVFQTPPKKSGVRNVNTPAKTTNLLAG